MIKTVSLIICIFALVGCQTIGDENSYEINSQKSGAVEEQEQKNSYAQLPNEKVKRLIQSFYVEVPERIEDLTPTLAIIYGETNPKTLETLQRVFTKSDHPAYPAVIYTNFYFTADNMLNSKTHGFYGGDEEAFRALLSQHIEKTEQALKDNPINY